jgi:hypothetical protein
MTKITFSILLCITLSTAVCAQQKPAVKKGTIKVQKKGQLAKIIFDDVNYRLVGMDYYGNIMDTAVLEFQLFVTIKGIFYKTSTVGPSLSNEMQQLIERRDNKTVLYFRNIKTKDRDGKIITVPELKYTFPSYREEEQ